MLILENNELKSMIYNLIVMASKKKKKKRKQSKPKVEIIKVNEIENEQIFGKQWNLNSKIDKPLARLIQILKRRRQSTTRNERRNTTKDLANIRKVNKVLLLTTLCQGIWQQRGNRHNSLKTQPTKINWKKKVTWIAI